MVIGIVGLGLMGASFARTLKKKGNYTVYGIDKSESVMKKAELLGAIDGVLTEETAKTLDMLVIALYPRAFKKAVTQFLPHLKQGAIVTDFCGVKRPVLSVMKELSALRQDVYFIGGHPMAGREYSGIDRSLSTLFEKASMILVPLVDDIARLDGLKKFYLSLGFYEVVICNADYHDGMIAYTSQLCHVVSNAFIKNQSAVSHSGYSAGSYRDLTRVARMNSEMWAQLMTDNGDKLIKELDELIANLTKYRTALENKDEHSLQTLLEEGNVRKLQIDTRKKDQ